MSTAAPGCPVPHSTFDLHDPTLSEDTLWAEYAHLRDAGGVSWSPAHGGHWILSRFDLVKEALRDHETFSSASGHRIPDVPAVRSIPIDFDPPEHTAYRPLLVQAIAPPKVRALKSFLAETIEELVAAFRDCGGGDAVTSVALPLPLRVLVRLVGFAPATAERFREHTERLAASAAEPARHGADRAAIWDLLQREIDRHRTERPDDYLTWLIDTEVDGRAPTDAEIRSVLTTLAVAGHETTMNAVSTTMYLLSTRPDLQRDLRADPSRASAFVEEVFRLRTPAQMLARRTTREVEVGGVRIPADEWVLLLLASADVDAGRYHRPDEFVADRGPRGHLAFGWGIHQCVGAALARSELRLLLETLARHPMLVPDGEPEFSAIASGVHYGPRRLPLRFA